MHGARFYKFALVAGVFVALFLIAFRPFGLYSWQHPLKYLIIAGYGIVTALVLVVSQLVVENLIRPKQWRLWQQALSIFTRTFMIGIANGIYSFAWGMIDLNWHNVLWFVFITFLVGIFPANGMILFDVFKQVLSKKQKKENETHQNSFPQITLIDENKSEKVNIAFENLLYIQSSDNYCEIVTLKNGKINKHLIRGSLKSFDQQIDHEFVIKCHRSFLVNLSRVKRLYGNSQRLRLYFSGCKEEIPVSRRYVQDVKKTFNYWNEKNFGLRSEKIVSK